MAETKTRDALYPDTLTTSTVGNIDGFNVNGLWKFDTVESRNLFVDNDESDILLTFDIVGEHVTGDLLMTLTLENGETATRNVRVGGTGTGDGTVQRVSLAVDGVMRAMMSPLHTVRLAWQRYHDGLTPVYGHVKISDLRLEQTSATWVPEIETVIIGGVTDG